MHQDMAKSDESCASSAGPTTYLFVDNVRFWSMACIVAMHSLFFAWKGAPVGPLVFALITVMKFGTIGFFLISGFLLGNRVRTDHPLAYLMRRIKKVFVPWSLWFASMAALSVWLLRHHGGREIVWSGPLNHALFLAGEARDTLFGSSFWFVPNLLLGICLLLVFRRVLYSKVLGFALLAINLFYSANIYGNWVESRHQDALLGFVFLLWLGSYVSHDYVRFQQWLDAMRWTTLAALTGVSVLLSFAEEMWLLRLHSADPGNTLRISNEVMALLLILLLAKTKLATWPRFIDVRSSTFGIYLSHWMILTCNWLVGAWVLGMAGASTRRLNAGERLIFFVALFVATYGMSLWLTQALAKSRSMGWSVGAVRKETRAASKPVGVYATEAEVLSGT